MMGGLCNIDKENMDCPMTTHIALFFCVQETFTVGPFLRNTSEQFLYSLLKQDEQEYELPF